MSDSLKNTLSFIVYLPLIIVCLSKFAIPERAKSTSPKYLYREGNRIGSIESGSGFIGSVLADRDSPPESSTALVA